MLASDLRREELLSNDEITGFPSVASHRVLIFSLAAISRLVGDLVQIIGRERASTIFFRYGHEGGATMALVMKDLYEFDNRAELLKACGVLQTLSGLAHVEFNEIIFNREGRLTRFSGTWRNSSQAHMWKTHFGQERDPVCGILTGIISGYATAIFGADYLVREISCEVQGLDHCSFVGRPVEDWGLNGEEVRKAQGLENLDDQMERLKTELSKAREDIGRRDLELKVLRKQASRSVWGEDIVIRSGAMSKAMTLAAKVAPTNATVLIYGESGTGKEVIARFIHKRSEAANEPFLAINCAALPANLLESELFGHVKGAFTGADQDKKGLFLQAGKGTLFLDELGEMPLELQAKLLRALEAKEVRPVGGLKDFKVEARIIAATNRDLRIMVGEGRFREDLFYRLAVFPIVVPPLRDRREDILPLARHFLSSLRDDHPGFYPKTVRTMETYAWPGNVRELKNWIEYALILAGSDRIKPEHLPVAIGDEGKDLLSGLAADLPTIEELERRYTKLVLEHTGNNKSNAADILGIGISTLWRRLKEPQTAGEGPGDAKK